MWKAEVQLQQLEYEGIFQWISPNRKKCYLCASTQNLTLLPLNGELICKNCKERLLPQKPKQSNDECEKIIKIFQLDAGVSEFEKWKMFRHLFMQEMSRSIDPLSRRSETCYCSKLRVV